MAERAVWAGVVSGVRAARRVQYAVSPQVLSRQTQQSPPDQIEIRQAAGDKQPMRILE